jgi:hypothetical protein
VVLAPCPGVDVADPGAVSAEVAVLQRVVDAPHTCVADVLGVCEDGPWRRLAAVLAGGLPGKATLGDLLAGSRVQVCVCLCVFVCVCVCVVELVCMW